MKLRVTLLCATGVALGLCLPVASYAENTCYLGQYILARKAAPGPVNAAVKEMKDTALASTEPLHVAAETASAIILSTQSATKKLVPDTSKLNLCNMAKANRRTKILKARNLGKQIFVRQVNCACNYKVSALRTSNDPYAYLQWGVNQSSDIDMNLPEAWNMCIGNRSTVVAVIDTGIDYTHPDLRGNMWVNPGEIAGNGLDDDGNGYIDDVYGANMINNSGDPYDDHGHGTHVAGTIGAVGDNGTGVVGVNWAVQIIGVKFLSAGGGGSLGDAIKAVDYVTMLKNRGVNIAAVNNSWGGGGYVQALRDSIERAKNAGIVFVAAAGNSSNNNDLYPSYPATYDNANVVSVASLDSSGAISSFSNYGATTVDIAAPGRDIASTYPGGQYYYMSGTSMASPHVTGALALLKSYAPSMTWSELKDTLLNTGRPLASLNNLVATRALVNSQAMLQDALNRGRTGPPPSPTPTATPTATPTRTPTPMPTATPTVVPGYFSLSGKITDGGNAVGRAKVTVQYGTTTLVTYTSDTGDYSFSNIYGPVNYTITVTKGGMSFTAQSSTLVRNTTLDISGSWKQYTLSVLTLDPQGAALAGVTINGGTLGNVVTDSAGRASFTARYGTSYTLFPSKSGLEFLTSGIEGDLEGNTDRVVIGRVPE